MLHFRKYMSTTNMFRNNEIFEYNWFMLKVKYDDGQPLI